jgi:hypothetical protein
MYTYVLKLPWLTTQFMFNLAPEANGVVSLIKENKRHRDTKIPARSSRVLYAFVRRKKSGGL